MLWDLHLAEDEVRGPVPESPRRGPIHDAEWKRNRVLGHDEVQVHVHRSPHQLVVVVADAGELLLQLPATLHVEHGQRTGGRPLVVQGGLLVGPTWPTT
jgi:hypothetical protein